MDNFHITKFGLLFATLAIFLFSLIFGTICECIGDKIRKHHDLHNKICSIKKKFGKKSK